MTAPQGIDRQKRDAPGPRPGAYLRWAAAVVLVMLAVVVAAGPGSHSVWRAIHDNLGAWQQYSEQHPGAALAIFFLTYAVCASLPLPVLTVLSLLAGCLFGPWLGTAVASLAYVVGVTLSFVATRRLLRRPLRRLLGARLRRVARGVRRDGALYLFVMRTMPGVPFFVVTWLMALTPMRARTFAAVSWAGVLPMTFLYANVGRELASMERPADVLSPGLLLSLAALAVLPLLMRRVVRHFVTSRGARA